MKRSDTAVAVEAGPTFRRYARTDRKVVPFFAHRYFAGYEYQRANNQVPAFDDQDPPIYLPADSHVLNRHAATLGAGAAVGLEWFPVQQMSLRGETGLRASAALDLGSNRRSRTTHDDHGFALMLTTYTTGISASFYLPQRGR